MLKFISQLGQHITGPFVSKSAVLERAERRDNSCLPQDTIANTKITFPLLELPPEIRDEVAKRIEPTALNSLRATSRAFQVAANYAQRCAMITNAADIPAVIERFPNLQSLDLSACDKLVDADLAPLAKAIHLKSLNLSGRRGLTAVGLEHIKNLSKLENLNLLFCSGLAKLPSLDKLTALSSLNVGGCHRLTELPSLDKLNALTRLRLMFCNQLTQLPSLNNLSALSSLDLTSCTRLTQLPSLNKLNALADLSLMGCSRLQRLPACDKLTALVFLNLRGCTGLTQLPALDNLPALSYIDLADCEGLRELPGLTRLPALATLDLSGRCGVTRAQAAFLPRAIQRVVIFD